MRTILNIAEAAFLAIATACCIAMAIVNIAVHHATGVAIVFAGMASLCAIALKNSIHDTK